MPKGVAFSWGYRRRSGPWGSDGGISHTHPYGEVLMFTGLDYDNPSTLSAEIEVILGDNAEKLTVDAPTFITLPAGYPHGPLVTKKAVNPFGFLAVSLAGEHAMEEATTEGNGDAGDLGKLVRTCEMRDMHRQEGSGNADYMNAWSESDVGGFKLNFTWAFHAGTGPFHSHDPHVYPNDECLVFVGTDPDNPDYLGADI